MKSLSKNNLRGLFVFLFLCLSAKVFPVMATNSGGQQPMSRVISGSSDATLVAIVVSHGELSPNFNPKVKDYKVKVNAYPDSIKITAMSNCEKAKVAGVGKRALKDGNNSFPITVTAENGKVENYTLKVVKK